MAPDLCKNVPLAVLFGSNGNSYAVSAQSGIRIYRVSQEECEILRESVP